MFSNMSGEVRNLLLVASELGGEVAQYVKVLRKEKERLLPIDEVQGEMEKLMKERDQAVASEESMFRALTKANDSKYAERRKVDSLKEQLAKQAEQLEHMQSNMVHANVYQRVAAERDRALAELRTNEHSYMREVDTLNRAITKLEASLAEREQYEKEVHQSLITQRDDALTTVAKEKARRETVEGEVAAALDQRDNMSIQLREWFQFFKKAIMATGTTVEELERTCYNREDLLVAISALRKECDERAKDLNEELHRSTRRKHELDAAAKLATDKGYELGTLRAKYVDLELSMQHEKGAHERLRQSYKGVLAKLTSIEALVSKPMSDICAVAFKAAEEARCDHDRVQAMATAVAFFIRSPIRKVLES